MVGTKNENKNLSPLVIECTDCSSPETQVKFESGVCLCEGCWLDTLALNPQRLEDLGTRSVLAPETAPLKIAA